MNERKKIDDIFKEAFDNLEKDPSPQVWEGIRKELEKDKPQRRVIPLWFKVAGVAALIALLFTIGHQFYLPLDEKIPPTITETEKKSTDIKEIPEASDTEIVSTPADSKSEGQKNADAEDHSESHPILKKDSSTKPSSTPAQIAKSEKKTVPSTEEKIQDKSEKEGLKQKDILDKTPIKTEVAVDAVKDKADKSKEEDLIAPEKEKPSILDAIAEQENIRESKEEKESPDYRWSIKPNVAPVYYSGFGSGSSIDNEFAKNPQKGDVNMSYGVQVSYALNDRLSVRSGINNVSLGYSTSDIAIVTGPAARGLQSVNYGSKETVVTAIHKDRLKNGPSNGFGELNLKSSSSDARLIQNINYYEVPLELQYAVINKRFGVNIIGGVSTLLLGDNEISVKAHNYSSILGEANNLSKVSFATNLGLGLDYKISRRFIFNLEPMFKYQLNPYTDSSVDFKPYYLGVYSGFSLKF